MPLVGLDPRPYIRNTRLLHLIPLFTLHSLLINRQNDYHLAPQARRARYYDFKPLMDVFMLIERTVNVDVDAMNPEFIKSLPITPHDQTSNQIHVHERMSDPANRQLLVDVAREYKGRGWLDIYTRAVLPPLKN